MILFLHILVPVVTVLLLMLVISTITGTRLKDYFSRKKHKTFISYLAKKWLVKAGEIKQGEEARVLTRSEMIQYGYRFANCYDCVIAGKCKDCKCDSVGKLNNKQDECSLGKFGSFLEDDELDKLLEEHPDAFKITVKDKKI